MFGYNFRANHKFFNISHFTFFLQNLILNIYSQNNNMII